jgi:hypothetical protein
MEGMILNKPYSISSKDSCFFLNPAWISFCTREYFSVLRPGVAAFSFQSELMLESEEIVDHFRCSNKLSSTPSGHILLTFRQPRSSKINYVSCLADNKICPEGV